MFDERVQGTEEATTTTSTFARTKGEEVWRVAVRASNNNNVNIGARNRGKGRVVVCRVRKLSGRREGGG